MASSYHISPKGPRLCRAVTSGCPYSQAGEAHYATQQEAEQVYQEKLKQAFGIIPKQGMLERERQLIYRDIDDVTRLTKALVSSPKKLKAQASFRLAQARRSAETWAENHADARADRYQAEREALASRQERREAVHQEGGAFAAAEQRVGLRSRLASVLRALTPRALKTLRGYARPVAPEVQRKALDAFASRADAQGRLRNSKQAEDALRRAVRAAGLPEAFPASTEVGSAILQSMAPAERREALRRAHYERLQQESFSRQQEREAADAVRTKSQEKVEAWRKVQAKSAERMARVQSERERALEERRLREISEVQEAQAVSVAERAARRLKAESKKRMRARQVQATMARG